MTEKPDYVVHVVEEDEVTIDWFFGKGHLRVTIIQLIMIVIGWFFSILPIVVTASALIHRRDPGGAWDYYEGFVMWDVTISTLSLLLVFFVVGFLVLHFLHRHQAERDRRQPTYDQERLEQRLNLADELYANKYGPVELRQLQRSIRIEPYADIETYELRDLYRTYGVD